MGLHIDCNILQCTIITATFQSILSDTIMIASIGCVFLLKLQLLKIINIKNIPHNELSLLTSIFAIFEV